MALKSETPLPPNGVVDIVPSKSAQEPEEDLEDGEIFDDEEDEVPPAKPEPPAPPKESIATLVLQMQQMQQQKGGGRGGVKRRGSPMDVGRPRRVRPPKSKRIRDRDPSERPFVPKKRRRSEEDKSKDDTEDEIMGREDSPPLNQRDWERFRSEDEDEELGLTDVGRGGMGMRRGRRDFGRSRRGGRGRGGGRRGNSRRDGGSLCKFFLQGHCQRGNDCPFSHQIHPKKYEMCKFYMNDCCVKKDKCNFMHEDFPCKFYHLRLKCYAGKRCRFSHNKVTPFVKQMLIKQNQADSDKHFLQLLQTTVDSRSPTPPDYSDYEGPHGNANYVTVTRKRGANRDDITVDDIELICDDEEELQREHEPEPRRDHDRNTGRDHRSRNQRSSRHSRDDYDHREHKEPRDHKEPREHRGDREHRPKHHNRERDHNSTYNDRHSDEDEVKTPMPSPSQNSNDKDGDLCGREGRSSTPPPAPSARTSHQRAHSRTPTPSREVPQPPVFHPPSVSEEPLAESNTDVPLKLPKKQMELYLRIQQQQREAENIEDENSAKEKEDEFKEDDWYSSDEDGGSGPLATILNKLKAHPPKPAEPNEPSKVSLPNVSALPDIDVSAVSRLLSSVRESIEQQKNSAQGPKASSTPFESDATDEKKMESPKTEDKRRRDPRLLRSDDGSPPSSSTATSQPRMKLPPLDIDLRISSRGPSTQLKGDVDLRQLPFKPVPMHQAAREIDASISANPPVPWVLIKIPAPPKPDYSQVQPKNVLDPRLRKYLSGGGMPQLAPQMNQMGGGNFMLPQFNQVPTPQQPQPSMGPQSSQPGVVRDPRQRAFVNDPRRKPGVPPNMGVPPQMTHQLQLPPGSQFPHNQGGFNPQGRGQGPPMGMYPPQGRGDSDLRNQPMSFPQTDIDLRFQQSTSHHQLP